MGVRTRGPDIKAGVANFRAYKAAREEAETVVDRWNPRLATGRDMLWPAHNPRSVDRRNAMARRLLSGLRHESGDRSADP
jgi:hypothetical protein